MKNDFTNNGNSSDSSIYLGKVTEEQLLQKQEEFRAAAEQVFREEFLKRQELEEEANIHIDNILSHVELRAEEEDYFTDSGKLWESFYKLFGQFFDRFGVDIDFQNYRIFKEKEEKENLFISFIKFLKLLKESVKKLINAILFPDGKLSFDQWVSKQIEELQQKLSGGILSEKELKMVLKELAELRDLKFQMKLIGMVCVMFGEFCEVTMAKAAERRATEEDKKVEKISPKEKEATKEMYKSVEIKAKVDSRKEPKFARDTIQDTRIQPKGLAVPKEQNPLRESPKNPVHPVQVINNENREVAKSKVNENKKAKSEEPKVAVCSPALRQEPAKKPKVKQIRDENIQECDSNKARKKGQGVSGYERVSSQPVESSVANSECDFSLWSNASAERKPQHSSANNTQPTGEFSNVKVNNHVDSREKAPSSSRGY